MQIRVHFAGFFYPQVAYFAPSLILALTTTCISLVAFNYWRNSSALCGGPLVVRAPNSGRPNSGAPPKGKSGK